MQRLTIELGDAQAQLAENETSLEDLNDQLDRALYVASHCTKLYTAAKPAVRRQPNQGFFEKLYVDEDGSVARAEVTEPFASLRVLSLAVSLDASKLDSGDVDDHGNGADDVTVFSSAGALGHQTVQKTTKPPAK